MIRHFRSMLIATTACSLAFSASPARADMTPPDEVMQCPAATSGAIAGRLLTQLVDVSNLPGISLAVGREGQLVWDQGYGFADIEQRVPATPLTRYRIGSISKPIAAAAIGVLLERGAIDLDFPVQRYAPGFPQKNAPITTRQLAGHTAGLRGYKGDEFLSARHYDSVDEAMAPFKDDPLIFAPGSRYDYTTYGWTVVSAAVEGAAKDEFRHFVKKVVLDPLNMRATEAEDNRAIVPNRARYYELVRKNDGTVALVNSPFVDLSNKWAGGGYISTMRDLVLFGDAHLGDRYLRPDTLAELMTPLRLNSGQPTRYGIGWETEPDLHGRTTIGHTGGAVGGSSVLRLWPDSKLVIAASTNRTDDPGIRLLGNALGEIFHPERPLRPEYHRLEKGRYAFQIPATAAEPAIEGALELRTDCAGYTGEIHLADGSKLGSVSWGQDERQATHLFAATLNGHAQIFIDDRREARRKSPGGLSGRWISPVGSRTMTLRLITRFDTGPGGR